MMMNNEISATTMVVLICVVGAVLCLVGMVDAYLSQKAQNDVLRKKLASASLAATTMSLKNKALEEKETDLLELLAESDKNHEVLLNVSKMQQLAHVELLQAQASEAESVKNKMEQVLQELKHREQKAEQKCSTLESKVAKQYAVTESLKRHVSVAEEQLSILATEKKKTEQVLQ